MKKKILSLILTFAMLLSVTAALGSTVVYAADGEVTTIASYEDLVAFVNSLATYDYSGKTVNVTANITVNIGWTANDGEKTATAAPSVTLDTTAATKAFVGTLNGNGNTISGLYINGVALIPAIANATIQNIKFDNCYTNKAGNSAIVAGVLKADKSAVFTNVTVSNSKIVNGNTNGSIAAILATAEASSAATTDCDLTNCNSIDNLFVSGAKTSLMGGLVGNFNKGTGSFTNCYNSSELYAMPESDTYINEGYKVGGMVGACGGANTYLVEFANCVNEGAITSFTIAGGILGDGASASSTMISCVNTATIKSDSRSAKNSFAGGMIGRANGGNAVIKECINLGEIVANSNSGAAKGQGGGAIGFATKPAVIVDFVNTANVTANQKAGGIIGAYNATSGTIERVITTGTVKGYNGGTAVNGGASCAIFGTWAQNNADANVYLTVKDFYYYNVNNNVFGLWKTLGSTYGNFHASYTAENKSLEFTGGVSNATDGDPAGTESANLGLYNAFFTENAYISDLSAVGGDKGADKFVAFGLGEQWLLTDTVPMPASAYKLLSKKLEASEDINYVGFQKKLDADTLQVRLIAELASKDYANTGFELVAVEKLATYATENGVTAITVSEPTYGSAVLDDNKSSTTVYTSLKAFGEDGAELEAITPSAEGKYLSAITVTGIPTTGTFTFIIKPYVTLLDGSGVEYGASFAIVVVNGVVSYGYAM